MAVVNTSYPGVYVTEVPSGVRSITGVATSVTAFVGPTSRGPVHQPVTVDSYAGYQRTFGGVAADASVSFAVRDYFANGGGQATVVRVVSKTATPAQFGHTLSGGGQSDLALTAADPGAWANELSIEVDHDVDDQSKTLFNLTVTDPATGQREVFRNVTSVPGPRRITEVLAAESALVRATLPTKVTADTRPPPTTDKSGFTLTRPGSAGKPPVAEDYAGDTLAAAHEGLWALELGGPFNLLCVAPPAPAGDVPAPVLTAALALCVANRAVLVVDAPAGTSPAKVADAVTELGLFGEQARNAALFYPRLLQSDPTADGRIAEFAACGAVAGVIARTDASRGVWKAPAGVDAALLGITDLAANLTDAENGRLNAVGINCLRTLPAAGPVVWGARTMRGADQLADEYRYLPVRRLALHIEASLHRGTQWAVFEPNDETLWSQLRLAVGSFLQDLFRQGAFQGTTPREGYFVRCDRDTTTARDVARGQVNVLVGFAPVRPAEFVILQIQQIAAAQA
jgi:Bacteriophage tail sheath protein